MMTGFKIWPQNANRTTFELLLAKKRDTWQNGCVENVECANCGELAKLGMLMYVITINLILEKMKQAPNNLLDTSLC